MPELARAGEKMIRGIAVSSGVCRGKILVLGKPPETSIPEYAISEGEVAEHTNRLEQALMRTRQQIQHVQREVQERMGAADASVFDAHLLVLEDPLLLEEVVRMVAEKRVNVEHAFASVTSKYIATLAAIQDDYLRERAADMRDVASRIQHNLLGESESLEIGQITEPCILVAHDLTPSRTALLDKRKVLGFATDQGSRTSHTAILARSLQIPAVTGLSDATQRLKTGQYALLDGFNGVIIVDPTEQTLFEYGQLSFRHTAVQERLRDVRDQPAVTLDGTRITLSANISDPSETTIVRDSGAEGVGLFRTEYLFMGQETLPTEEEQFQAYLQVASALKPLPVIIRTLDLGGDKFLSHRYGPEEANPFLGFRAIRISLQEPKLFRDQLRAILRASVTGNVKLMYPMISSLDELNQANALVETYKSELRAEGIPFDDGIEIGAMIEIPAAVLISGALAKRVRFFSVGTNDLIQYSLAVDRLNPKIAHLYEPTHPGVLRLIKAATDAAHAAGIWVGVCGEMAGDPVMIPLLLGLGVDELSAAPAMVPAMKFMIRRVKLSEAGALAEFALHCESGAEILSRAQALAKAIAPSLFEDQV